MVIPDTFAEDIYSESRMNNEFKSPSCLFLPSNEIMTKMILACVDVKDPKDLWLFKKTKS